MNQKIQGSVHNNETAAGIQYPVIALNIAQAVNTRMQIACETNNFFAAVIFFLLFADFVLSKRLPSVLAVVYQITPSDKIFVIQN